MKTGRNSPCPCGSGKKYKKCCLDSIESNESGYRRQRQTEAKLLPLLLEYALAILGQDALHNAWTQFNDFEEIEEFDIHSPMTSVFATWFLFNWEFQRPARGGLTETTIAESFWVDHESDLTAEDITFLDSATGAPYSLCEILDVKPGIGMRLLNLFTREDYEIVEPVASEILNKGEIIYCATIEIDRIRWNVGTAPFALLPTAKGDVLKLRDIMVNAAENDILSEPDLVTFEFDIRALYLNLMEQRLAQANLANTDNESVLTAKAAPDL